MNPVLSMTAPAKAVEVDWRDFQTVVDVDGYPEEQYDLPDALNEGTCSGEGCGTLIGSHLYEGEDDYGRVRAGNVWEGVWLLPNGRYVCEDCAIEHDESIDAAVTVRDFLNAWQATTGPRDAAVIVNLELAGVARPLPAEALLILAGRFLGWTA